MEANIIISKQTSNLMRNNMLSHVSALKMLHRHTLTVKASQY